MRRFLHWLTTRRAPARFVCRAPKQGEWVWDGIEDKPTRCPYDTASLHYVLEPRPARSRVMLWLNHRTAALAIICALALCSCTTRLEFGNEGSSGYVFKAGSGPAPCKEEGP